MVLYVCGARGSFPVSGAAYEEFGQATTCFVCKEKDYAVVIDCGSGLWNARELLSTCKKVDVLLSHVHYDHIMGLLMGPFLSPGTQVRFFSNFKCWFGKETLSRFFTKPFWPVNPEMGELRCVGGGEIVTLQPGITAAFRASRHDDGALMPELQWRDKRICVAMDFEHGEDDLSDWVRDCNLLIYDGTYRPEEYADYQGWGHSTWEEGCRLAAKNHVERLLITHHSPRNNDETLRREEVRAQALFPRVTFAREGTQLKL